MDIIIIALVWAAMIASGVWESSVEGRNTWDRGKTGWKLELPGIVLTKYHVFLFWIAFPLLLALPLVVAFSWELVRTLAFAYAAGLSIQDFSWFVSNPLWPMRDFTPEKVDWYPWLRIGRFAVPAGYVASAIACVLIAIA